MRSISFRSRVTTLSTIPVAGSDWLLFVLHAARHDEIGQSVDADAAPWKDVIDRR